MFFEEMVENWGLSTHSMSATRDRHPFQISKHILRVNLTSKAKLKASSLAKEQYYGANVWFWTKSHARRESITWESVRSVICIIPRIEHPVSLARWLFQSVRLAFLVGFVEAMEASTLRG